jgi:hypothetical protein
MRAIFFLITINIFTAKTEVWEDIEYSDGNYIKSFEILENGDILFVNSNFRVDTLDNILVRKNVPTGILRSTNDGETWLEQEYFLPSYFPIDDIEQNQNGAIYISAQSNNPFISYDNGQNFNRIWGISGGFASFTDIEIYENNNIFVYNEFFISRNIDGQDTIFSPTFGFNLQNPNISNRIKTLWYDGFTIYIGRNGAGVTKLDDSDNTFDDNSITWTPINDGLESLNIDILKGVGNTILAATSNDGIYMTKNSGDSWSYIFGSRELYKTDNFINHIEIHDGLAYL